MTDLFRPGALAAGLALFLLASPGQAQEAVKPAAPVAEAKIDAGAFDAPALDDAGLRRTTGREDLGSMAAIATQRNTVANNSVTGTSTTGDIRIDGDAFQNLQGLAVISANSGNNVAINSAMNVTISMGAR